MVDKRDNPAPASGGTATYAAAPPLHAPWSRAEWIWAGLLVLAIFAAYRPAWHGGFVWDDDAHVPRADLRSWDGLATIWFPKLGDHVQGLQLQRTQQYFPLLYSAFWLQYQLWDGHPLGYHLTNILMHAIVALLLAQVLRRLRVPGAFFAAAIFALHPVQVESVAWITELKNTLSAAFYLAAMMAYLDFDQSRRPRAYLWALALFVLSLLSKTVTATLPAAMLVIFWWQRGQLSWRRDVRPLLPFFALAAASGVFVAWWEHSVVGAHGAALNFSLFQRCLIAGHAIWFYLGKLFWPVNLIFFYPQWDLNHHRLVQALYGAAAIGLLVVLWKLRVRWRAPLAAYLFYVGTLFPLLGFSNAVLFKYTFVADHFQYLASMGMIALVAGVIAHALGRSRLPDATEGSSRLPDGTEAQGSVAAQMAEPEVPPGGRGLARTVGYAMCVALLAVLAALTWRQSSQYKDLNTLFQETLHRNPGCWLAYNYLGNELLKNGQIDDAVKLFRMTLKVKPDHAGAHQNLASCYERRGQLDDAEREYREAIKYEPDDPKSYNSLAMLLARRGRFREAVDLCRVAQRREPQYAWWIDDKWGQILQMCGKYEESIPLFKESVELSEGQNVEAQCDLAISYQATGRPQKALACYGAAIRQEPKYIRAYCGLGRLLQAGGQYDLAMSRFKTALIINDKSAEAHVCMALALRLRDRWKDALKHYRRAAQLEPKNAEAWMGAATILAECPDLSLRNGAEAVELARRADDLSGHRRADVLLVLAAAYSEAGKLDDAVATAKKALDLAIRQKQPQLERMLRERLRLYESR
jgi:tetratricopeptide (TPR) repeat protein